MLVYKSRNNDKVLFSYYKNLHIEYEINKLDRLIFEIPNDYRHIFRVEGFTEQGNEIYEIKNIEPYYDGYKIESVLSNLDWKEKFNKSLNFPYKTIEDVLKGIMPNGWSYKLLETISKRRTITADHKTSWQVLEEAAKKFDIEFRLSPKKKEIICAEKIYNESNSYLNVGLNVEDKDISIESFDFATRIVPEGMNGLKINQINDGKDYLEDNSYSDKVIHYYWKDERYTNIKNLKDEAQRKLEVLARPKINIELKVKDLRQAVGVEEDFSNGSFGIGDYVYLIDQDRKTKEQFRVLRLVEYPYRPMDNEITLSNKPEDIVDDMNRSIELTEQMWEETRVRFETTDKAIEASVATNKRYTDDSFKTYKTERKQTDKNIYESILESTTYVDPVTGQTKPIIDKQLEIDKTVDGINIKLRDQLTANNEFDKTLDNLRESLNEGFSNTNNKINKDLQALKEELGEDIDYTKVDFKKRHDLLKLELESAAKEINEAKQSLGSFRDDFENRDSEVSRELLGIKTDISLTREKIQTQIDSVSKATERAVNDMGSETKKDIKTYLLNNYSSSIQTDQKIENKVGRLKTSINEDIDNLSKEINEAYSLISQTNDKITSQVTLYDVSKVVDSKTNGIEKRIRETESKITQTANQISSRVKENEIISAINQTAEQVKIKANKINFEGSTIDAKGTFRTLNGVGESGVEIKYNNIKFKDNRWNGKTFGNISVARLKGTDALGMLIGHYQTSHLGISYWSSKAQAYYDYVTFDRWNYTGRRKDFPVTFNEKTHFKDTVRMEGKLHFDKVRLQPYSNGLAMENYSGYGLSVTDSGEVWITKGGKLTKRLDN